MSRNIVVIPDSFKGSASSTELCEWIKGALLENLPGSNVHAIPVADGGEGTVDAFAKAAVGWEGATVKRQTALVCGRLPGERVLAEFAIIERGGKKHAIIETASCAGLASGYSPLYTTTYGIGEQIREAIKHGCTQITVGLGGSCTNDGGTGLAAALGVRFYDKSGCEFVPVGSTLSEISDIDVSAARELLSGVRLSAMCDVDNPTVGERGAAYVFAPQKGARQDELPLLDAGLRDLCDVISRRLGIDVSDLPGGGAAGGMGAGMHALLGAELRPGIDTLLDVVCFDELLCGVDFAITGEGKLDKQSLSGKAAIGVARRCKAHGVPVIILAGGVELDEEGLLSVYSEGVTAIFAINRLPEPFETARLRVRENVTQTVGDIARLIAALCNKK
ncbi:MAG TPA: glycerate kinase [Clostridiales bacterium]|nr:glycerate kinase [Clostridiales bacterium]